eukprot:TRINITY_DN3433_c0_g3_i1.p1 TRINITY_DN3433_c0_g3~~TRINITY_DN3433_c0_g3_i1.p1  ORF type:complete len:220 (-),score=63.06 TRINITY_DN3433_c0_g3_i1:110-769(-)
MCEVNINISWIDCYKMRKKFLKIMILGNAGVGKTAILERYVNKMFTGSYKVTIGADFLTRDIELDGNKIKLQIWDTAGQEKYRSLGVAYYRGADACILVFDLCDKTTFKDLDKWLETFQSQLPEEKAKKFPTMLFGNKADKVERIVSTEAAQKWCSEHDKMPYYETSAKTNQGLEEAFEEIARIAMAKMQANDTPIGAHNGSTPKRLKKATTSGKKTCC